MVFANSVLGARTQKYADYLDICAAITGRVPKAGPHLDEHRVASVVLDAAALAKEGGLGDSCEDAFFPALGHAATRCWKASSHPRRSMHLLCV